MERWSEDYDPHEKCLVYKALSVPQNVRRWMKWYGRFEHGSRLECVASIARNGLRGSKEGNGKEYWGTRGAREGVFRYAEKDSHGFGLYTWYSNLFNDGWYWGVSLRLLCDYDERKRPTVNKQVVVPSQFVFIMEIRLRAASYVALPQCSIVPVWLPELESV